MAPSRHIVGTAGPQVSLVTGASRGVGAAIAHRLARDGFAAAVNFTMNATEAARTVHTIEQEGRLLTNSVFAKNYLRKRRFYRVV